MEIFPWVHGKKDVEKLPSIKKCISNISSMEGNFSIQFLQCRENCVGTIKDVGGALFEFYMKDVGGAAF